MVIHICHPSTGKCSQEDPWESLASETSLLKEFQASERLVGGWGGGASSLKYNTLDCLWMPYICTHVSIDILMNVLTHTRTFALSKCANLLASDTHFLPTGQEQVIIVLALNCSGYL